MTNEKVSFVPNTKNKVVVDMDEVLTDIVPYWMAKVLSESSLYEFLKEHRKECLNDLIKAHPSNRLEYCVLKHLGDYEDNPLPEWFKKKVFELYFEDENFYHNLQPTPYAKILRSLVENKIVSDLLVVTKCGSSIRLPVNKSKILWLQNFFEGLIKTRNIKFCFIEKDEKKSDAIKEQGFEDYNTFVDDHIDNIMDVIKNTDSRGKEFLIPKMTYNSVLHNPTFPAFLDEVDDFYCQTLWFDNSLRIVFNEETKEYRFKSNDQESLPRVEGISLNW